MSATARLKNKGYWLFEDRTTFSRAATAARQATARSQFFSAAPVFEALQSPSPRLSVL
jgi:hypothetical protein